MWCSMKKISVDELIIWGYMIDCYVMMIVSYDDEYWMMPVWCGCILFYELWWSLMQIIEIWYET